MKVYGTSICIDCRNYKVIQENRGFEAEYIDITENVANLRAFMKLRDTEDIYKEIREKHGLGIPLFVHEDGRTTFDFDEAFAWIGQPPVRDEEIAEKREEKKPSPFTCAGGC